MAGAIIDPLTVRSFLLRSMERLPTYKSLEFREEKNCLASWQSACQLTKLVKSMQLKNRRKTDRTSGASETAGLARVFLRPVAIPST